MSRSRFIAYVGVSLLVAAVLVGMVSQTFLMPVSVSGALGQPLGQPMVIHGIVNDATLHDPTTGDSIVLLEPLSSSVQGQHIVLSGTRGTKGLAAITILGDYARMESSMLIVAPIFMLGILALVVAMLTRYSDWGDHRIFVRAK